MARGRKPNPFLTSQKGKNRTSNSEKSKNRIPKNRNSEKSNLEIDLEPPDFLGDVALEEWHRVVPHLVQAGLAGPLTQSTLMLYCQARANFEEYSKICAEHPTVETGAGGQKRNPLAASLREAVETLRATASELGFTPAAMARIRPEGPPKINEIDEIKARREERQKARHRKVAS